VVTARLLVKVAGVLVGVVVLRLVAGVWLTEAVLAGLAVVGLVAGWAGPWGAGSTAPSTCPGWCGCGPASTWTGSRSG
jgi:hypothetical protein